MHVFTLEKAFTFWQTCGMKNPSFLIANPLNVSNFSETDAWFLTRRNLEDLQSISAFPECKIPCKSIYTWHVCPGFFKATISLLSCLATKRRLLWSSLKIHSPKIRNFIRVLEKMEYLKYVYVNNDNVYIYIAIFHIFKLYKYI